VKIGFLQLRPKFGEIKHNVKNALSILKNVTDATIVLPEMFNTGYLFRNLDELKDLSESIQKGYTVPTLKKVAKQKQLNLVFGIAEKKNRKYYNTSVLITSKGKVFTYQKTHLFDREKLFFQTGTNAYQAYTVEGMKLGMMVCFDWIYPEVTRVLALKGVHVICHPANLVLPWGQEAMRIRSIENRVFSITANRIGTEKRGSLSLSFSGKSQIVDPEGNILASAGERSESLKIVDVDVTVANDKHVTANNDIFKDRKISLYKTIAAKKTR
jgi:predicted amidohydrolase